MLRRSMIAASAGAALLLSAGAAFAAQAGPEVDSVTVFAPNEVRLTVAIGGELAPGQVVTSAPIGMRCGGAEYQFTTRENRQCWLWVRRNQQVMLTAQGHGAYGTDWTVAWSGCEPVAGGPACKLTLGGETVVAAVFSRGQR